MAQVNTSVEVIEIGIKIVNKFGNQLVKTAQKLEKTYENAGQSGWNDSQYQKLGGIIHDCSKKLVQPVNELENLKGRLESLKKAVENYSK